MGRYGLPPEPEAFPASSPETSPLKNVTLATSSGLAYNQLKREAWNSLDRELERFQDLYQLTLKETEKIQNDLITKNQQEKFLLDNLSSKLFQEWKQSSTFSNYAQSIKKYEEKIDIEGCLLLSRKEKEKIELKKQQEEEERLEAIRRAEEDKLKKEQEELRRQEEQKQKEIELLNSLLQQEDPNSILPSAAKETRNYRELYKSLRVEIEPQIDQHPQIKSQLNTFRREINKRIGQLTNTRQDIFRVTEDIATMFNQAQAISEAAFKWLSYLTSVVIIHQCEVEVRVRLPTAYPIAHVCVFLFHQYPIFYQVFLATVIDHCPYVVPQYFDLSENAGKEKARMARKPSGWESDVFYQERMVGIFAVYAAILQTLPEVGSNPHSIRSGWTWLSRILNMEPRTITPWLVHTFLVIAGDTFFDTYQDQAIKLASYLINTYLPTIPQDAISATTRIKNFFEHYQKHRQLPTEQGRLYQR